MSVSNSKCSFFCTINKEVISCEKRHLKSLVNVFLWCLITYSYGWVVRKWDMWSRHTQWSFASLYASSTSFFSWYLCCRLSVSGCFASLWMFCIPLLLFFISLGAFWSGCHSICCHFACHWVNFAYPWFSVVVWHIFLGSLCACLFLVFCLSLERALDFFMDST